MLLQPRYQINLKELYASHQDKKYEIFNEWCTKNGVKTPKLDYPAVFDGGLLGARVNQDIQHREAFLYVPFKMLLTLDYVRKHPQLGMVVRDNPHLFSGEEHDDWEQLTLALGMLYEYQLGTDSFWFPYLNLLPQDIEFFCNWPLQAILETDDFELAEEALAYKRDIEKEWQDMKGVMLAYPELFSPEIVDRDLFMRIFAQVCSRCFGWGLPCTSMIPMADNMNHSHGTCVNETINLDYHLRFESKKPHGGVPRRYFTRDKFMNDYSAVFSESEVEQAPVNILGGRFSRENFNKNIQKYSLDTWRAERANNVLIWNMTYKEEDYDEDNDTEEEEEGEESEEEEEDPVESVKKGLAKKAAEGRLAEIINPKKGFKFFIEQEQKYLAAMEKKQRQHLQGLQEKQKEIHDSKVAQEESKVEDLRMRIEEVLNLKKMEVKGLKIACISDTHNKHASIKIPEGVDVLVVAGDFTGRGQVDEVKKFNQWLGTVKVKHIVVVAGNHDFAFERTPEKARSLLTNCIYLEDSSVVIEGVTFYGSPWQPRFHDWAFNLDRGAQIKEKWDLIPSYPAVDVLITHGPPFGILDKNYEDLQCGCMDLNDAVRNRIKPQIHIFGHIHEQPGRVQQDGILYINATTCNLQYKAVNPPIVVDVAPRSRAAVEEMKGPVGPKVIDLTEGKPVKKVEEMKPVEEKEEDEDDIDDDEEMSASDQEDYEVEDEDFSWYNDSKLKDSTYFVLVNCDRRTIRKGEQAFYCYGKRSNAFLILNYGFCYADNRYDSLHFNVKLNVNMAETYESLQGTSQEFDAILPHPSHREDLICSEEIRLKFDLLNTTLLGYFRTIFRDYFKRHIKPGMNVLLTKPRDLDYELFIFKRYEGLMRHLLTQREKRATLDEDLHILKTKRCEEVGYMQWMAMVYRSEKKKILKSQLDLCAFVIRIVQDLMQAKDQGRDVSEAEFHGWVIRETEVEKRHLHKDWVHNPDAIFSEEDQIIRRRIQMRTYLRDLFELSQNLSKATNFEKDTKE